MKFEGGVHRVQRVPKTEIKGRIHTSTITVAILPQPSEVCTLQCINMNVVKICHISYITKASVIREKNYLLDMKKIYLSRDEVCNSRYGKSIP